MPPPKRPQQMPPYACRVPVASSNAQRMRYCNPQRRFPGQADASAPPPAAPASRRPRPKYESLHVLSSTHLVRRSPLHHFRSVTLDPVFGVESRPATPVGRETAHTGYGLGQEGLGVLCFVHGFTRVGLLPTLYVFVLIKNDLQVGHSLSAYRGNSLILYMIAVLMLTVLSGRRRKHCA